MGAPPHPGGEDGRADPVWSKGSSRTPDPRRVPAGVSLDASWLIPVMAAAAFIVPMALRRDGLMPDWTNHLWLVWKQGRLIGEGGPSLFVSAAEPVGIFYPFYCFYGGTLYAVVGAAGWVLGDRALAAYLSSYLAGCLMAQGGMTWLTRQYGLRGWRSQVPGLLVVTSAYYLTNAYGRGAWTEFMATSAIPLVAAAGLWLLRASRWHPLPVAALVGAVVLMSGSHNITSVWGGAFLSATGIIAGWAFGLRGHGISLRRVGQVVGVAAVAVSINGWYLVPAMAHLDHTAFYNDDQLLRPAVNAAFSQARMILSPFRAAAELPWHPISRWIYTQAPVLPLLWGTVVMGLTWRQNDRPNRRLALALWLLLGVLFVLLFRTDVWHWLPRTARLIQYSYRLHSYVILATAGLVLCGLRAVPRDPGRLQGVLVGSLIAVLVFGSCQALWQVTTAVHQVPPGAEVWMLERRELALRSIDAAPRSWYDHGVYRDFRKATTVTVSPDRRLNLDASLARRRELEAVVDPPPGPDPFVVNLAAPAWAVDVEGIEAIGHDASGYVVARRPAGRERGPIPVRVRLREDSAVALGRRLSLAAVSAAAALILVLAVRRRRLESDRPER